MNRHPIHQKLFDIVDNEELRLDFHKFYEKKIAAAGTRVRSAMQELKKHAQNIRQQIQEMKNNS